MLDRAKAKARKARYLERQKVKKYGPDAAGIDMRGRHGNHARGPRCARWSEDRMIADNGYVKIRVGNDHPLADPNGYAYEHLVVWSAAGRTLPGPGELLHHRDEVKTNNQLGNLEKLTRSKHGKLHIGGRHRDAAGRLLDGREHNDLPWSVAL